MPPTGATNTVAGIYEINCSRRWRDTQPPGRKFLPSPRCGRSVHWRLVAAIKQSRAACWRTRWHWPWADPGRRRVRPDAIPYRELSGPGRRPEGSQENGTGSRANSLAKSPTDD